MEYQHIVHEFAPVCDEHSEILILGSLPSVKSRETGFYYGHPQNRFWKVMAAVLGKEMPMSTEEKKDMLLRHHVALWDVIQSCDIRGSSDSSIKNVEPTDIVGLLPRTNIRKIFVNGKTAERLYQRFQQQSTGMEAYVLPSTSPANAAWSFERLVAAWRQILK